MKTLSERVTRSRQQRFVGRDAEIELFRTALLEEELPFAVLHIYGPGGVGKTTLLHELARLAAAHGRPVIHLDGRHLDPTPAALEAAGERVLCASGRPVLLVDTYERLAALDGWMRSTFLGQLPIDTLVVIGGRHAPTAWISDAGWADLTRIISLGNLGPDESQSYLAARGVPPEQHEATLAFTHGHPLALSLMAELYRQSPTQAPAAVTGERDVLQILLDRFLQDVPTIAHREALELCALARTTTEALLASHFGPESAAGLFQWLRPLSFIEQGPFGIWPHDLVREVLEADLHWRNPTGYRVLQRAALRYLRQQAQQSSTVERQRLRLDSLFLNRRAPGMRSFFIWDAADVAYAEPATPADFPTILEMVRRHEGSDSAELARYWQERQPEAFLVYRTPGGEWYGFMMQMALHQATAEDAAMDPAVAAALRYVARHRPPGAGDAMSHMRFWMARDSYQAISPAVNITAANCVIHWSSTSRLVWSFVAMANPDFMAPHFESIRFPRTPDADFMIGGRRFGVFSHDWVAEPVEAWLSDTRHSDDVTLLPASTTAPPMTEREFAAAVRQAFRDFTRLDRLAANPLCHSALLAGMDQSPERLQVLLRQAIETLHHNPKDIRLYRALWHTYIEPEATQERAAERLDLPFNTYRYHLSTGLGRITSWLWRLLPSDRV